MGALVMPHCPGSLVWAGKAAGRRERNVRLDDAAQLEMHLVDVFLLQLAKVEEDLALYEAARHIDGVGERQGEHGAFGGHGGEDVGGEEKGRRRRIAATLGAYTACRAATPTLSYDVTTCGVRHNERVLSPAAGGAGRRMTLFGGLERTLVGGRA